MRKTLPQAMERFICPTLLHGKILMPERPGSGSTFSPPPNALSIRAQGKNADIIWLKRCSKRRSSTRYARQVSISAAVAIRSGRYLHTTHHSSIVRICYHHHPFFGQTADIIRWLRRQTADSLVIKLQDGLELEIGRAHV